MLTTALQSLSAIAFALPKIMHHIEFSRSQSFLLEESNIQRILGIVHESFDRCAYLLSFLVVLASGKMLKFDSVDGVLRHDNTLADPIQRLWIRAENSAESSSCEILFDREQRPYVSKVTVKVRSNEQRWAAALSAELEEQVERTKMPGFVYQLRQSSRFRDLQSWLVFICMCAFLVLPVSLHVSKNSIAKEEAHEILRLAEAAQTQSEKVDILLRAQISSLREKNPDTASSAFKLPPVDAKLVIGLLPLIVGLLILWYPLKHCYPPAIYSWGDSGKQFQRLLERRKNLWSTLLAAIVLSFVVSFSTSIISGWLGV